MLIDAHLHLDKYGDLLDEALKQIETERIFTVAIAMDVPSYLEMRKIGERCELVLPTFGIHPRRAADHASRLPELGRNIETSPAIGEIALDFQRRHDDMRGAVLVGLFSCNTTWPARLHLSRSLTIAGLDSCMQAYSSTRAVSHLWVGPRTGRANGFVNPITLARRGTDSFLGQVDLPGGGKNSLFEISHGLDPDG
jgi:Tat protein secretion system quality control protein TatD with DNase activity